MSGRAFKFDISLEILRLAIGLRMTVFKRG